MLALFIRIVRQFFNDKRSLVLMLFAPMFIMTFLYLIFGESDYRPKIVLVDIPVQIETVIIEQDVEIVETVGSTADELLEDGKVDGILSMSAGVLNLHLQKPDAVKAPKLTKAVGDALKEMSGSGDMFIVDYHYGSAEDSSFSSLGYMFLGVLSFFFIYLLSGVSFIRERTYGTVERFMLAPVSRMEVVAGYIIGFGFFAVLQSIFTVFYSRYVLGMPIEGSIAGVLLLMVLLAIVAVETGAVVSVFANNEFQVAQFIPIVVIPQLFFSGLIPVDTLPFNLGRFAFLTPIYHACSGLEILMVRGGGFIDALPYCGALLVFIVILFMLNVRLLKKYRLI